MMKIRDRNTHWMYHSLNLVAVVVLVCVIGEQIFELRHPFFDVGAPLGLVLLFFMIPLGGAMVWWRRRRWTVKPEKKTRVYYLCSHLVLSGVWLLSCLLVTFYVLLYLHFMPKPWLTSNQGPDTEHSVAAFKTYFGFEPQGKVRAIYNTTSPDMSLFRFDLEDRETLERITRQLKLLPVEQCRLNIASPPEWWNFADSLSALKCYANTTRSGRNDIDLGINTNGQTILLKHFRP